VTQALRRNSDFLQKKETLWDMREAERLGKCLEDKLQLPVITHD